MHADSNKDASGVCVVIETGKVHAAAIEMGGGESEGCTSWCGASEGVVWAGCEGDGTCYVSTS